MFTRFLKTVCVSSFLFSFSLNAYQIGSYSLPGRKDEDRLVILEDNKKRNFVAAVFDGHVGSATSEFLFQKFPDSFSRNVEGTSTIDDALRLTFQELDEKTKDDFTGSTAVVCCNEGHRIYFGNIVDSRAVLFDNGEFKEAVEGEKRFKETVDHKIEFVEREPGGLRVPNEEAARIIQSGGSIAFVYSLILKKNEQEKIYKQRFVFHNCDYRDYEIVWCDVHWNPIEENSDDMERIKKINTATAEEKDFFEGDILTEWYVYAECFRDGEIVPGGLGMSRSFGDSSFRSIGVTAVPDIYTWFLKPGDKYLVVASDGLWNAFDTEEVEGKIDGGILCGQSAEQIIERLCRQAREERGCPDDISLVLVIFDKSDFVR